MSNKNLSHERSRVNALIPEFLKQDCTNLVKFLKEYYLNENDKEFFKSLDANDDYIDVATNLISDITDNRDLDKVTEQKFIEELANTVTKNVPASSVVTRKFLIKRLVDYYDARGNTVMVDAFFRLFFNKNVTVFEPYGLILRPSIGSYSKNLFVRIFNNTANDPTKIPSGTRLFQKTARGTVVAEGLLSSVQTVQFDEVIHTLNFQKDTVEGTFDPSLDIQTPDGKKYGKPYRTLTSVKITNGGSGYAIGENLFFKNQRVSTFVIRVISVEAQTDKDIENNTGKITQVEIDIYGSGNTQDNNISNKLVDFVFQDDSPENNVTNLNSSGNGSGATCSLEFSNGLVDVGGRYNNARGRLSDDSVIQDSNFFQKFSYELSTDTEFASYKSFYLELLHPAGEKVFHNTKKDLPTESLPLSVEPLNVKDFFPVDVEPDVEDINIPQTVFVVKQDYFNIDNTEPHTPLGVDAPYILEDYITTSTRLDG